MPQYLAGRERERDKFRVLLSRLSEQKGPQSIIYSGIRGVGKTVLLSDLHAIAREKHWASTGRHEVGTQPDFRLTFGRMAAKLLYSMSTKERMKSYAERALSVLGAFTARTPGFQLQIEVPKLVGIADSGDPEEDLADLLEEIGEVARAGEIGALFIVDEMQNLDYLSLSAICMAFQRIGNKQLPIALVGAGLPFLRERLFEAKPYASRLFAYETISNLPEEAACAALTEPARMMGVEYEPDAIEAVLNYAEGHPYLIQQYGRTLWEEVESGPLTLSDVEVVEPLVKVALAENFFETYFKLASDKQQLYLMAMASLGDGPYKTPEVSLVLGKESPKDTSKERGGLIKKELVWVPRRTELEFSISRFGEFLRESHPYRT